LTPKRATCDSRWPYGQ